MILLHLVLASRRIGREGGEGARLARAVNETFVIDMDDDMREMTFGDLAVPREMKRAAAALYDRHRAYLVALDAADNISLQEALRAQMAYLDADGRLDAAGLAGYVREAASDLDGQTSASILEGHLAWPEPPADPNRGHQ